MSQAERLSRMNLLLRSKGSVSRKEIQETFEISRATFMRDIEMMRDRLGAPLVYDAEHNTYKYDKERRAGLHVDELPGLWITPDEGYAFLTMFNVLRAIDPGFLMHFLDPVRRPIKQMLSTHDFRMRRLDEKVKIDLPKFARIDQSLLIPVFSALVMDTEVHLRWVDGKASERECDCLVTQLKLQETGWQISVKPTKGKPTLVGLESIRSCRAIAKSNPDPGMRDREN